LKILKVIELQELKTEKGIRISRELSIILK